MALFRVHTYAIVRVPVTVNAVDQADAIKQANELNDFHTMFAGTPASYADDIDGYLVDDLSDTRFENSTWYDKHGNPETKDGVNARETRR